MPLTTIIIFCCAGPGEGKIHVDNL